MKKSICLYAGYDKNNIIHDYVVYYIRALSERADVYYMGDFEIPETEADKIRPFTCDIRGYKHGKYDFGSWQELINHLGWDKISSYDELILANDSCYGPLTPFTELWERMKQTDADFWSITDNHEMQYHLQSYFIVFKQNILKNAKFRDFFAHIKPEKDFYDVVANYEVKLTPLLRKEGFKSAAFIENANRYHNPTVLPFTMLKKYKIPLIKVKAFTKPGGTITKDNLQEYNGRWRKIITKHSDYDLNLIDEHLQKLHISYKNNFLQRIKQIVLHIFSYIYSKKHTRKDYILIKFCKIPVLKFKCKTVSDK